MLSSLPNGKWGVGPSQLSPCLSGGLSWAATNEPQAGISDPRDTCTLPPRVRVNATTLCARPYFFGPLKISRNVIAVEEGSGDGKALCTGFSEIQEWQQGQNTAQQGEKGKVTSCSLSFMRRETKASTGGRKRFEVQIALCVFLNSERFR